MTVCKDQMVVDIGGSVGKIFEFPFGEWMRAISESLHDRRGPIEVKEREGQTESRAANGSAGFAFVFSLTQFVRSKSHLIGLAKARVPEWQSRPLGAIFRAYLSLGGMLLCDLTALDARLLRPRDSFRTQRILSPSLLACTRLLRPLLCLRLSLRECLLAKLEQRLNCMLAGILLRSLHDHAIVFLPLNRPHSTLCVSKQSSFLVFLVSNNEVGARRQISPIARTFLKAHAVPAWPRWSSWLALKMMLPYEIKICNGAPTHT
ncbi:uncharacterized protein MYCFIDRAFT_176415 [Pseudocercospora fijiensis CIRAD86]|uniref:Uncharacterized protein n=1 Tax=Pseudocercospora fijiensis (strain CIRAD86) TaxID=383855 RepID=M2ZPT4_PSEFD|nr:uncharacterized protein MYCFIDRAFT_176415 [Pseudocercospora fijiensis CIRAD86]EME81094.1 hypothetical protein MYCFIDRAFT_176415 [Pseudocercospora fijiensis CIRAD86]